MLFILLVIVGLTSSASAQQTYLEYRLKPSSSYSYDMTSNVSQTMSVMSQEIENDMQSTLGCRLLVREAVLKQYELELHYDTLRMGLRATGLGEAMRLDTSIVMPGTSQYIQRFMMTSLGNVLSLSSDSTSRISTMIDGAMNNMTMMKNFITQFPGRGLNVKDTWTVSTVDTVHNAQLSGDIVTRSTVVYTLTGMKDTLGTSMAIVDMHTSAYELSGSIRNLGMDMVIEGEGTARGTIRIDVRNGLPIAINQHSTVNSRMAMTGQQSMLIPMTIATTSTIRRRQ
ncbi:MAG: hypothetical protein J0I17_12075 ['Candidatus Kapabacteria' thiocyanatum]|uniref:Uncharacterized protein n=1 Tax=Candidatus Kapaibacterium thiocyanatum TaxID=1895771 RepID=A0A1M3L343_9BACT|nr:hypothetical protein ['Candidatus Kapabacteria' thiocyanatum]OJX59734.1 MAG: hypothetical protein BGO89_05835 ['Candidatus Kapabacteria' thiocyanatum]